MIELNRTKVKETKSKFASIRKKQERYIKVRNNTPLHYVRVHYLVGNVLIFLTVKSARVTGKETVIKVIIVT